MPIRKILVPIDFSEHSSKALDLAIELAKPLDAELVVLHCYQIQPMSISTYGLAIPPDFERSCRDAATRELDGWRERAVAAGVKCDAALAPHFASEEIAKHAEEVGADLIVMGTRGLSGLKHVLAGSVAERTVRIAPCPVLTVKAEEAD